MGGIPLARVKTGGPRQLWLKLTPCNKERKTFVKTFHDRAYASFAYRLVLLEVDCRRNLIKTV